MTNLIKTILKPDGLFISMFTSTMPNTPNKIQGFELVDSYYDKDSLKIIKIFRKINNNNKIKENENYKCFLKQCCNCHYWSGLTKGLDHNWLKAHCDKKTHLTYRDDTCDEYVPNIGKSVY